MKQTTIKRVRKICVTLAIIAGIVLFGSVVLQLTDSAIGNGDKASLLSWISTGSFIFIVGCSFVFSYVSRNNRKDTDLW